jgi:hypothetical protein
VDRPTLREPAEPHLAEFLQPLGKRIVIGDRELDLEHLRQGAMESFCLSGGQKIMRRVSAASMVVSESHFLWNVFRSSGHGSEMISKGGRL